MSESGKEAIRGDEDVVAASEARKGRYPFVYDRAKIPTKFY
jgi:hypothetical protein